MATCTCLQDGDNLNRLNSLLRELLLEKEIQNDVFNGFLIQRRIKNLKTGDAFIPRGRISSVPSQVWDQIISEVETRTKEWPIPFICAEPSKDIAAVFHLNRTKAFQHVLRRVKKQNKQYGVTSLDKPHRILLNCAHLHSQNTVYDLQQLRALLLTLHIINLLHCNGYSVVGILPGEGHWNDDILRFLDIDSLRNIPNFSKCTDQDASSSCMSRLLQAAADSTHQHKQPHIETNDHDIPPKTDSDKTDNSLLLDLRSYLNSSDLDSCAVKGFDKNLNLIEVCRSEKATPILEQVSSLETCFLSSEKEEEESIDSVMHIVSSSLFYTQQQVHLIWKMLSPTPHSLQQFHIEFGPVQRQKGTDKNSKTVDALTYLRKRQDQMEDAAKMKYGILGQGAEWESMMRGLLNACVKFELLQTVCKNVAKVDLFDSEEQPDATNNQGGPFVIYNCARLAMLFENFRKAVKQGVYPKLPVVSKCDMSTLKLEEEWILLYNFIEPYPSLVKSTLSLSSNSVRSEIHTHKIVSFLVSLSHCFSSYYSRVHILTEPRPHLLPVMFARLHLMSAVHQVMQNGLQLLDIVPPKQL